MDLDQVKAALAGLPLGGIRYFDCVGSTNDEARQWAAEGAADFSLALSNTQSAGRGRSGRTWYSPAGSSLAFSLVVHPQETNAYIIPRLTALGALAGKAALVQLYNLPAQIKWPNDILVHRQKLGGVLAEAIWDGDCLQALVLGIGINVACESGRLANQRAEPHALAATSIEAVLGEPADRLVLLKAILEEILYWRPRLSSQAFLAAWEASLAFRGEWVQIIVGDSSGKNGLPRALEVPSPIQEEGLIIGLAQDGSLLLRTSGGATVKISAGEIHLRPVNTAAQNIP
jgi:BirA family transcriptional regulator, biotin operon repressor / biotin---[acetyl-CoA-carboxylase] ligase